MNDEQNNQTNNTQNPTNYGDNQNYSPENGLNSDYPSDYTRPTSTNANNYPGRANFDQDFPPAVEPQRTENNQFRPQNQDGLNPANPDATSPNQQIRERPESELTNIGDRRMTVENNQFRPQNPSFVNQSNPQESPVNTTPEPEATQPQSQNEEQKITEEKSQTSNQKISNPEKPKPAKTSNGPNALVITLLLIAALVVAPLLSGIVAFSVVQANRESPKTQEVVREITNTKVTEEQSGVIDVAQKSRESVVSVVISREVSNLDGERGFLRRFLGNETKNNGPVQVGAGTGFIATSDGIIITNKHVVEDTRADYTVIFDDETQVKAEVLARDTILDIAILKIQTDRTLKPLPLGDSDKIQVGQTAIAIGNSLGEFSNTVSKGIISGLGRTITASDSRGRSTETLEDIIQTDASINPGNSGGPLLDINGNVVGVNVARSSQGENVAFSISINGVKPLLESVIKTGKIERPYIGVRYSTITKELAESENLSVDYGALIKGSPENPAIIKNSPADKAGLKDGDIILEINGQKVTEDNDLRKQIQKYKVGESLTLKILRGDKENQVKLTLEGFSGQ